MRIALCHQTFAYGDAIGRDIAGMCQALEACGHEPFVLCEYTRGLNHCEISHDFSAAALQRVDLFVFHHSQYWARGAQLLESTDQPVVYKFHNITPAHFFDGYCAEYADSCRRGEELTRRLLQPTTRPHRWLCDSAYNASILHEGGEPVGHTVVVPPFNNCGALLHFHNQPVPGRIRFVFVGRFAPNKGHLRLLDLLYAYRCDFGADFDLSIVGSIDPKLRDYWTEFTAHARRLSLEDAVRVYPHASDEAVHQLLVDSHAYLTLSQHEGFCVPVIEAQALGLPVVGLGSTAVRETAGPGQLLLDECRSEADFAALAECLHHAVSDHSLRHSLAARGRTNVLARFIHQQVEERFMGAILPFLQP